MSAEWTEEQVQQITFAQETRGLRDTFYHFSYRPSTNFDRRGFSQQDSAIWELDKIYQNRFIGISKELRNRLVIILANDVPLDHRNKTMLAVANYIVYDLNNKNVALTPKSLDLYFQRFAGIFITDLTGKTTEEVTIIHAKFKATLFRYIEYVNNATGKRVTLANMTPS